MISKKSTFLILGLGFVLALVAFTLILKPGQSAPATSETLQAVQESVETSDQELELETVREFDEPLEIQEKEIPEPLATGLSADLQAIKDGKQSVLGLIFSDKDLNQQLDELLQLSEAGESWADYAIGQVTEMCAYLYETPESQLIAMFSGARAASSPEQQAQMTELLPMVVDASKRCKTLEADKLKALGDSRDWFDKAAEAKNPNAFVISGYSLLSQELFATDENYLSASDEQRSEAAIKLRDQAKQLYRDQVKEFMQNGQTNPETLMSMAEHLNLFYPDGHRFKQQEAWMLLACEQGYEKNCAQGSMALNVFCMFDSSCQTGGDFKQGVLWAQGQYQFDEYQRIASELKRIIDAKDWDKLGF